MQRQLIFRDDLVDVLQHAANRLADVLDGIRIGRQRRHAIFCDRHTTGFLRTALERHGRHAGQPCELQTHQRVLADRRVLVDGCDHDDALGVVELDRGNFADFDAVEIDVSASAQARSCAFEYDAQWRAGGGGAKILEPEHESEGRGDHRQRERPDQDEICLRFHRLNSNSERLFQPTTASQRQLLRACHENRPAATGAARPAYRSSYLPREPCDLLTLRCDCRLF